MRLLLVDDDTLTRRTLVRKLRGLGHAVRARRSVAEAALLPACDAWLLVSRPGGEAEACAALRAAARERGLRFASLLLVAEAAAPALRLAACEAGADGVLDSAEDPAAWRAQFAVASRAAARERAYERSLANARHGLEAAAHMQRSLLPPDRRTCPGVQVAWSFLPSASVAGDLLGAHALDETRTAFFLLDVSGHGVPAAMFSCSLSLLLLPPRAGDVPFHAGALAAPGDLLGSPGELLMELNRRYLDDAEVPRHVSIVYGVLDATRGLLRLAQAGLPAPLIQRGGSLFERSLPGPPVGLLPNALYDEIEMDFVPGQRLFLHSDGISECPGRDGRPFGSARLRELLESQRDADLPALVRGVEGSLQDWRGGDPFPDDVSFLALEAA